jgi:hypothetical protein
MEVPLRALNWNKNELSMLIMIIVMNVLVNQDVGILRVDTKLRNIKALKSALEGKLILTT